MQEVIKLGATRVVFTSAAPLGCYPYILRFLATDDTSAYDELGCLKAVNNVAVKFNKNLLLSLLALQAEFPKVQILPTDYYATVIAQIKLKTPPGKSVQYFLKSRAWKKWLNYSYKYNCPIGINYSIVSCYVCFDDVKLTGAGRENPALRSCCGGGGRNNYDIKRFCGSPNVTACPNPKNSIYWDGLHFTQQVYRNVVAIQIVPALLVLRCRLI